MISAMVLLNTERGRVNEVAERLAELNHAIAFAGREGLGEVGKFGDERGHGEPLYGV